MNRAGHRPLLAIAAGAGMLATAGCEVAVSSVGSWQADVKAAALDAATPPDAALDVSLGMSDAGASFYIEAELGRLNGDFITADDPGDPTIRYLETPAGLISEDAPGSATATYGLEIETPGDYLIWARFHTPDRDHNRIWASVDGGPWTKWRSTTGDIWFWYFLHPDLDYHRPIVLRSLARGHHELVLANCTDGVKIDRIYVTSRGLSDQPPGNDTSCSPPDSIPLGNQCVQSCGALFGNSCEPEQCAGRELKPEAYDCAVCCYIGD